MANAASSYIPLSALGSMMDPIALRDPRGRRARHRVTLGPDGRPRLALAGGPLTMRTSFHVTKRDGAAFTELTGDDNPIHREGDVIAGAYTIARLALPLEILLPEMAIASIESTFTAVTYYDRRTTVTGRLWAEDDQVRFEARLHQGGRESAIVRAGLVYVGPSQPSAVTPRLKKDVKREFARVRSFLRACRVRPLAYFRKPWGLDLTYPTAFLAALPSGELVRRFEGGAGGMLNRLSLEFEPGRKVALASHELPEAQVKIPSRLRKTFNRVATLIRAGIHTLGRGNALVLSAEGAAERGAMA